MGTRLTFKVTIEEHTLFKQICAARRLPMNVVLQRFVAEYIKSYAKKTARKSPSPQT